MNNTFDLFDGKLIDANQITFNNRAFTYGDGLFETMKVVNGKPLFIEKHVERLHEGMQYLKLKPNNQLTKVNICESIELLCKKNNVANARVRLTVIRNSAGYYTPDNNEITWHLSIKSLPSPLYSISDSKINAGLFKDEVKSIGKLSNIKSLNCLVYVLAGIEAKELNTDDVFIMNTNHAIIEATSSNVFFKSGNKIITPPLSDGCLNGVMRNIVLQLLSEKGYEVSETSVNENDLIHFEEVILTNVIHGARNIDSYQKHQYKTGIGNEINKILNEKFCNE